MTRCAVVYLLAVVAAELVEPDTQSCNEKAAECTAASINEQARASLEGLSQQSKGAECVGMAVPRSRLCSAAPEGGAGRILLQSRAGLTHKLAVWGEATGDAIVPPSLPPHSHSTRTVLNCRTTVHASQIQPGTTCPRSCPFWAEETGDHHCQFQCVRSSECGSLDPNATVADQKGMYCRACIVPGCELCNTGGGGDFCSRCRSGYTFFQGACLSPYRFGWFALYSAILLLLVYLLWWYFDLVFTEVDNEAGLDQGLRFRSRTRLHRPKEDTQDARVLWPLDTNLLQEQVAGPGLALFFHFQLIVLLWALCVTLGWVILSLIVSKDLLILGTKKVATPQQLCTVTTWGFQTQHSLLWAKVAFMWTAYFVTFLGSIIFATLQLWRFQLMDDDATMKDYAALASKLPACCGSDTKAEENLKSTLERATGEEIVGVSICWNFSDQVEECMAIIEADTERKQRHRPSFSVHSTLLGTGLPGSSSSLGSGGSIRGSEITTPEMASARAAALARGLEEEVAAQRCSLLPCVWVRNSFSRLNACLGFRKDGTDMVDKKPTFNADFLDGSRQTRLGKESFAEGLLSTDKAFVVFKTEEARDAAVQRARQTGGVRHSTAGSSDAEPDQQRGTALCKLQAVTYEPDTVVWANFNYKTRDSILRLIIGIFFIIVALLLWTICFYLPYALYVTSFSYARGERPTGLATLAFTLLVVAGNQTMYFVCRAVSEWARFKCQDTTEMTYLTLYFLACFVNFGMDMAVTSYTTYIMMVGMNARTSAGTPLEELSVLQVFESYPMQKALGHFFFWYAFPSCFLIPFIVEPLFTIILPGHLMQLLVRTHPSVVGMEAERALGFMSPMDLSRYSDILLNMTIAVMSFLFPGSFVWKMFLVLFACHTYIILMDHYRVLRAVPAFHFSTNASELCVQALTAIPVGLLAACTVFKYHSTLGSRRLTDGEVMSTVATAFTMHVMVHWFLLFWLVPKFARHHVHTPVGYEEVSRKLPCSWFSANPVHCLRSRYLHEHTPPCTFYFLGKEHLLEANPDIGIYFEEEAAEVCAADLARPSERLRTLTDWMFGRTRSETDQRQSVVSVPSLSDGSSPSPRTPSSTPRSRGGPVLNRSPRSDLGKSPRSDRSVVARRQVTWHVDDIREAEGDEEKEHVLEGMQEDEEQEEAKEQSTEVEQPAEEEQVRKEEAG